MNDAPHSDDKRAAAASDSCASEAAPSLPASPAPVDVISEAPTSGVEDEHTRAVTAMFSRMTPWYDFQNHAFSLGFDFWWRRNLVRAVAPGPTGVVLDLAAGTLDVTLALIRRYPGLRVIAADICAPMLDYGMERKVKPDEKERITPLVADARRLPLPDASVDAVAIAFGIRNVRPRAEALAEMHRVLTLRWPRRSSASLITGTLKTSCPDWPSWSAIPPKPTTTLRTPSSASPRLRRSATNCARRAFLLSSTFPSPSASPICMSPSRARNCRKNDPRSSDAGAAAPTASVIYQKAAVPSGTTAENGMRVNATLSVARRKRPGLCVRTPRTVGPCPGYGG